MRIEKLSKQAQVIALEEGVEMELVSDRIGKLRAQKEALETALSEIGDIPQEEDLMERLEGLPDLTENLRKASP